MAGRNIWERIEETYTEMLRQLIMLIDDIRKKDGAPREPAAFVRRFYERFTLVSLREIGASDFAFVQAKPHGSKYAHEMLTREASTDPLVP
ncbi:Hypothetical protein SMAX5B_011329 [Scophthalmus maximus]|uniref:Uncharacterized protein n=1 Tax=Scophthalmus maximus TaxID=52904 RepID=A0A2U9BMV6_SCOMX|nr:Hypothetical protein SMAX5B_011329 [Scophthalmus maximus]